LRKDLVALAAAATLLPEINVVVAGVTFSAGSSQGMNLPLAVTPIFDQAS